MKLKFTTVIKLDLSKVILYFEVRNWNYLTHIWLVHNPLITYNAKNVLHEDKSGSR
jgi:hypothetical protein